MKISQKVLRGLLFLTHTVYQYVQSHILILRLVFVSETINVATIVARQDAFLIPDNYSVKALGAPWDLFYNLQNFMS